MRLRPTVWLPALLLLAGTTTAAPAFADREVVVNEETKSFALEDARTLRLDVSVGELHVEVGEGNQIEAHLKLRCERDQRRCRDRASRITLVPTRGGDDLRLKVAGYDREERRGIHRPEVDLRIVMPAALSLQVDMGVGELEIDGIEGDVTVDLGVGEAEIVMPEDAVRSVAIDVGVGEAEMRPRREQVHHSGFLFLGNEIDWRDGTGRSRVVLDVGVGEATVRLVP